MHPTPITDDLGAVVPLTGPVARVVSLVPSLTESIATSRPELLVGCTDWCTHPVELDLPRVRGTKNPDLARIIGLRPDLVVCNQEENRQLDVQRLRAAGVPVWVSRIETVDEAIGSLHRLFTEVLGGVEPDWLARARELWTVPAPATRRPVVVAIWRDPWMVVGRPTFTADLLARLGADCLLGSGADRYPTVTPAEMLAAEPDLILLPDEPYPFSAGDGPEVFSGHRTVLLSGRLLTWYGPSLVPARAELESALHTALSR